MCNYPELQRLWKPKIGDETNGGIITEIRNKHTVEINEWSGKDPYNVFTWNITDLFWLPGLRMPSG
jgi:hypothetical protein